jgi:two-component system chemotaxis response regulator CheB
VLVIDDSALVRQILAQAIARAPGIEVMATAADPLFAMDKMRRSWPDVIILDIEMPRMDGLAFLRKLMAERPTPVIICSSLAESGSGTLMQALAAGAVSVVSKPKSGLKGFLEDAANDIIAAVRSAAGARVGCSVPPPPTLPPPATRARRAAAGSAIPPTSSWRRR